MSGCREGLNLFRWVCLKRVLLKIRKGRSVDWRLVREDTLGPIACKLAGHRPYQTDVVNDPSEWACRTCHTFLKGYKP